VQSSSTQSILESTVGQALFIGPSQYGNTRITSGYYSITARQGAALAIDETGGLPTEYALRQNYPNPFNPSTTIEFDLPIATEAYFVIYDLLGREVNRLVDGWMEPGYHRIVWQGEAADGGDAPSGIYIARLRTPGFTKSIKMVLLK
jgi:hypothetical protein